MPLNQLNADDATTVEIYIPHLDQVNNMNGTLNVIQGDKTIAGSGGLTAFAVTAVPGAGKYIFLHDIQFFELGFGTGAGTDGPVQPDDDISLQFLEDGSTDIIFFHTIFSDPIGSSIAQVARNIVPPGGYKFRTANKALEMTIGIGIFPAFMDRDMNARCNVIYSIVD